MTKKATKKTTKKTTKKEKKLSGYVCVNEEKLKRVIYGSMVSGGKLSGGVGEDAPEKDVLAEYDKLGGLITKKGIKVKTGSFYDFENKKARIKPKVILLFTDVAGRIVEVPEGKAIPPEVRAAQYLDEEKKKSKKK